MSVSDATVFDVIILGAGPAGSTCALALGDSGLRVALLEKSSFPRQKTCGDAVAAYVPKVLATISRETSKRLDDFSEKLPVNTCRFVAPNRRTFDIRFNETGFISRRIDFDNFLFAEAASRKNISVFQEHYATDVSITPNGVTVTAGDKVFSGSIVIGCDGAHSIINRKITGTRPDPDHHCGAVRVYYRNVADIQEHAFEIHLIKELLPGYFWIFPLKGGLANVGLGVLSSVISKRKLNLRALLDTAVSEIPYIRKRFANAERIGRVEGYDLPLGSRKIPISGTRFMLCGDAASLIDPLSGEGIGQAIVSGRYAGWQALKCFEANNFSADYLQAYDAQVYSKFWRQHRKNHIIQNLANHEWLLNGIFNLAVNNSWAGRILSKSFL